MDEPGKSASETHQPDPGEADASSPPPAQHSFWPPSRRAGCALKTAVAGVVVLYILHSCALIPTHHAAERSFVLPRDRDIMKRLFKVDDLPKTFRVEAIQHHGWSIIPGGDGPLPVQYVASVAGSEFDELTRNIQQARVPWNMFLGNRGQRPLSINDNDKTYKDFRLYVDENDYDWSSGNSSYPQPPTYHTTSTLQKTWDLATILVDDRSSATMHLFITTRLPYDK